jgi:hypothetical protein
VLLHESQDTIAAPPEQFSLEHHGIRDIAVQVGDTLQPVRGGFHFMPMMRQVLLGNIKKRLVSVRNQYSHSTLHFLAAMWPRFEVV